jgi:hypothetical protein
VRSFGRLVLDMLPWLAPAATPAEQAMAAALEALGTACDQPDLAQVPTFAQVAERLAALRVVGSV